MYIRSIAIINDTVKEYFRGKIGDLLIISSFFPYLYHVYVAPNGHRGSEGKGPQLAACSACQRHAVNEKHTGDKAYRDHLVNMWKSFFGGHAGKRGADYHYGQCAPNRFRI